MLKIQSRGAVRAKLRGLGLGLLFFPIISHAVPNPFSHPFYLGINMGYGSTMWSGLVPKGDKKNLALSMSTPVKVEEGGAALGLVAGFEINSSFAIEASYLHFEEAKISFDQSSLFSFLNDGLMQFYSHTEAATVMGKLMVRVLDSPFRVFSSVGLANVHREDTLVNNWRLSPTFGIGLNYQVRDHLMAELGGTYIAGYGESQLSPADAYYPFLYMASFRLLYCFG